MTTSQFEAVAKTAICEYAEDEFGLKLSAADIETVWMCHIIGNKKGLFIEYGKHSRRYYEVTWNAAIDEMYLDVYEKKDKVTLDMERVQGIIKRAEGKA
jgi:hypothetical protein